MASKISLNGQTVDIVGTKGSLSLTENFGFLGNQGFTITSLHDVESLVSALKVELAIAWPGTKLVLETSTKK